MGAEFTKNIFCNLFECLCYVFLCKTRIPAEILSINVGDIKLSMADLKDDPMEFAERFKESVSSIEYTMEGTNTGIQLQKDISFTPVIPRILRGSVNQDSLTSNFCIDYCDRLRPCLFESSLSKRRQGRHSNNDCSICSSFFLQDEYKLSLY